MEIEETLQETTKTTSGAEEGFSPLDSPEVRFPETKTLLPCSWAECGNGHKWKPVLALVECPECKGPCLMAKMENCPFCNEPVLRVSLRHDHLPKGGGIARRCLGQKPHGESVDIILERNHWKEVEGQSKEGV